MISVCVPGWGIGLSSRRLSPIGRLLALVIISFVNAMPASAQIRLDGINQNDQYAVCANATGIFVPDDDDCETPFIGQGDDVFPISGLTIGPAGSQTNFNSSNGAATFGGGATFNSPAIFNAAVTMSGNRIENVGTPTAGTDAANKQYVDDQNAAQDTRITAVETVNTNQQTQIDSNTTRITSVENVNTSQQTQIDSLQTQANEAELAISSLQSDVRRLDERDDELAEGIAISLALDAPILRSGQTFAMRGGWGNFDGSNAAGFTAAGAISRNVVVDAGVGWGTSQGTVAGKAGVTIGW